MSMYAKELAPLLPKTAEEGWQREAGKAAQAALEAEWKVMVADHEKNVAEWRVQCKRLRAENM